MNWRLRWAWGPIDTSGMCNYMQALPMTRIYLKVHQSTQEKSKMTGCPILTVGNMWCTQHLKWHVNNRRMPRNVSIPQNSPKPLDLAGKDAKTWHIVSREECLGNICGSIAVCTGNLKCDQKPQNTSNEAKHAKLTLWTPNRNTEVC